MGRHNLRRPLHYTTAPTLYDAPYDAPYDALNLCSGAPNLRPPLPPLVLPPPSVPMPLRLFRRLPLRLLSLRLLSLLLLPAIPVDASPRCPAGAPTFACTMYPDSADIRACSTSVIEHCIWRQRTMHVHSPLYLPLWSQMHCALHIMHASCTICNKQSYVHIYAMICS